MTKKICEYCREWQNGIRINGKIIRDYEWKDTKCKYENLAHELDFIEMWIMKGECDKKAAILVDNGHSARYFKINYCFMCGRKLNGGG